MAQINNIVLNGTKYDVIDKNSSDRLDKLENVIVTPTEDDTTKTVTIQGGAIKFVDKEVDEDGAYTDTIKAQFTTSANQLGGVISTALLLDPSVKYKCDEHTVQVPLKNSGGYSTNLTMNSATVTQAGCMSAEYCKMLTTKRLTVYGEEGKIRPEWNITGSYTQCGEDIYVMMPQEASSVVATRANRHIFVTAVSVQDSDSTVTIGYIPEQKFAYLPASTGLDGGYYIVTANVAKPTATGMSYESFHILQRNGQSFKFLKTIDWADAPIEIKNLFGVGSISINAINQDE